MHPTRAALFSVVAIACSTSPGTTDGGADASATDANSTDAAAADTSTNDASPDVTNDASDAAVSGKLYAHTSTALYQIDPNDASLTPVSLGAFDCIGGTSQDTAMTDLAVDKAGALWGISAHYVYSLTVQTSSVHCASTVTLNNPSATFYGLSFAPVGVLDSTKEVLVGVDTAGELWAIDAAGALTEHGTLGAVPPNDGHGHNYVNAGKLWELSGDIVFAANGTTPVGFATVRDCPNPPNTAGCNTTDTLIEIDLSKLATSTTQSVTKAVQGQIVKSGSCTDALNTSYGGFYGIAAWQGDVIGFSHSGAIVRVNNVDGTGCLVSNASPSLWGGAGATTLAPIVAPP
jgi:hypothetical protein